MIKALILMAAFLGGGETIEAQNVNTSESVINWKGSKVVGSDHVGTLSLKEGSLDIKKGKLMGGSFVIDMTSINNTDLSGGTKEKLEGHLKSDDFFGVGSFPTASFSITEAKASGKGAYDITGDLTIKGKTESISFPATMSENGGKYEANATITFDRTKFDVRYGSGSFFDNLGDKAISDEIELEVKLVSE